MFIQKKDSRVMCESCKIYVDTYIQHLKDQHSDDPEWFFEPWDGSEYGLYYCPKCKNQDYLSDSELFDYIVDELFRDNDDGEEE